MTEQQKMTEEKYWERINEIAEERLDFEQNTVFKDEQSKQIPYWENKINSFSQEAGKPYDEVFSDITKKMIELWENPGA